MRKALLACWALVALAVPFGAAAADLTQLYKSLETKQAKQYFENVFNSHLQDTIVPALSEAEKSTLADTKVVIAVDERARDPFAAEVDHASRTIKLNLSSIFLLNDFLLSYAHLKHDSASNTSAQQRDQEVLYYLIDSLNADTADAGALQTPLDRFGVPRDAMADTAVATHYKVLQYSTYVFVLSKALADLYFDKAETPADEMLQVEFAMEMIRRIGLMPYGVHFTLWGSYIYDLRNRIAGAGGAEPRTRSLWFQDARYAGRSAGAMQHLLDYNTWYKSLGAEFGYSDEEYLATYYSLGSLQALSKGGIDDETAGGASSSSPKVGKQVVFEELRQFVSERYGAAQREARLTARFANEIAAGIEDELRQQIDAYRNSRAELARQLEAQTALLEQERASNQQLLVQLNEMKQHPARELVSLRENLSLTEDALHAAEDQIVILERKVDSTRAVVEAELARKHANELAVAKAETGKLQALLDDSQSTLDGQTATLNALQDRLSNQEKQAEAKLADLRATLDARRKDLAGAQARIADLEAQVAAAGDQTDTSIRQLRKDLGAANAALSDSQARRKTLEQRLDTETRRHATELDSYKARIDKRDATVRQRDTKIAALNDELGALRRSAGSRAEELAALLERRERALEAANKRIAALEARPPGPARPRDQEIAALNRQIEDLTSRAEAAEDEVVELKRAQPKPAPRPTRTVFVSPGPTGPQTKMELALVSAESGDYQAAFNHWLPLAEQGNQQAQSNLGVLYAEGLGVKRDEKAAVEWFKRAAEGGYVPAQYNLGIMYFRGNGVSQSYPDALAWFKRAGEKGDLAAIHNVGFMYVQGLGVAPDIGTAKLWFQQAADDGNVASQYNLGELYARGQGAEKSYIRAAYWFRRAADAGDADAQYRLAELYFLGQGLERSYFDAYVWSRLAAERGHEQAELLSDQTATRLSGQQLTDATVQVQTLSRRMPRATN